MNDQRHVERPVLSHALFAAMVCVAALAGAYPVVARATPLFDWRATFLSITVTVAVWHLLRRYRRRREARLMRARLLGQRLRGWSIDAIVAATRVEHPTAVDWLMSKLLPRTYWPVDPTEGRTALRLDVHVRLSGADRLRLLLTGDVRVLATVYTDTEVREARTLANVEVHPFETENR